MYSVAMSLLSTSVARPVHAFSPGGAQGAAQEAAAGLPPHLAQVVWPGHLLGAGTQRAWPSGHPSLDAELPGGGWPAQALSEILQPQAGLAEWRLLLPVLRQVVAAGGHVLLIGPPRVPHLPGLAQQGLPAERVIRIEAATAAERLWTTEQALLADGLWAVMSWLPQARPAQVRRLQACANRQAGPVFLFRPEAVLADASAAPLRLHLSLGPCPHPLVLRIVKRRGPLREAPLHLASWPPGLLDLLPPGEQGPLAPLPPSSPRVPAWRPPLAPATLTLAGNLTASHHAELDRPAARSLP
jgi:protein ImuA